MCKPQKSRTSPACPLHPVSDSQLRNAQIRSGVSCLIEDRPHGMLDDFVLQGSNAQRSLSSIRFGYVGSLGRLRTIRAPVHPAV